MVHTLSLSFVRLDYDQWNCNLPNEPHVKFILNPHSALVEAWTFKQGYNRPLIHLRTTETAMIGHSVKLNPPSFLMNKEAKRFAISFMVGEELEADQNTKEAIVDEIIYQSDETIRNMDGFGIGDKMFTWRVTVTLYVSCVHVLDEEDIRNDEVIARLIDVDEEYEEMSSRSRNVMIPATKSAIEGLEKVKMNVGDFGEANIGCVICLEDIKEGTQVSRLNCLHAFHGDCIRAWLERSHYCPLCRFALPT